MNKYCLINANLLDGTKNCKLQKGVSILIEGKQVKKIGKFKTPKDVKEIDINGGYVLPGLINLHTHLPASGKTSKNPASAKKLAQLVENTPILKPIGVMLGAKGAKTSLMSGVTTLRAVGGVGHFDSILRDKINAGKKVGSRLFVCDYAIAPEGGHMVGTVAKVALNEKDCEKYINDLVAHKVDWIKLMITGGVLDVDENGIPGSLKMEPKMVKYCCDLAHKNGLKVCAHIESYEGTKAGLEGGVDSVEHGSDFDEYLIELFKKNKSCLVETISPALPIGFLPQEVTQMSDAGIKSSKILASNIYKGIIKALENDIPIGLGTDAGCPMTTHYNFWRELEYFYKATNIPRERIIYHATLGNAKILGKDNEFGSIEKDKLADIIVCRNNPLEGFDSLKQLEYVIKEGKIYKNPKVKKDLETEKYLDSLMNLDIEEVFKSYK